MSNWRYSEAYFRRINPDGSRQVSWRTWVLIWLVPFLFALATLYLLAEAYVKTRLTVPTTGEVVRVYSWEDETGVSPLFRYTWTDGTQTEATPGIRHEDWNFEVGSTHDIRYFAGAKRNIVLPGAHNWFVAQVIGLITLVVLIPAVYLHRRMRRWLNEGAGT